MSDVSQPLELERGNHKTTSGVVGVHVMEAVLVAGKTYDVTVVDVGAS